MDGSRVRLAPVRCKQMALGYEWLPSDANRCHMGTIWLQTDGTWVRHPGRRPQKPQVGSSCLLGCLEIVVPMRQLFAPRCRQSYPSDGFLQCRGARGSPDMPAAQTDAARVRFAVALYKQMPHGHDSCGAPEYRQALYLRSSGVLPFGPYPCAIRLQPNRARATSVCSRGNHIAPERHQPAAARKGRARLIIKVIRTCKPKLDPRSHSASCQLNQHEMLHSGQRVFDSLPQGSFPAAIGGV